MNARLLARAAGAATFALALAGPLAAQGAPARPIASPRDTAMAMIGGAHVMVDYGRPSKRGRQIYGGLVPLNSVWRTGANAATTLVTDRALTLGKTALPAGTYTLYSLWNGSAWSLIVNKQTGQWGTSYAQGQDLARIPMTVRRLSVPVETLTVVIPSGRPRASFVVKWDDVEASVPITVPTGNRR